jgi:hypothetical protein
MSIDPRYYGGFACEWCSDTGRDIMFDGSWRECPCVAAERGEERRRLEALEEAGAPEEYKECDR